MRQTITILILVLCIFGAIVLFTGFLGTFFSKTAEMIGLIIIAAVLLILLIKSKQK